MELQGAFSVYVVDQNNKIEKRGIKTGLKIGRLWLITEGLADGERIVYEGLQKVKPGATVNPKTIEIEQTEEESK
jgi:membrane fusion protein (multidrug efflux system)